MLSCNGELAIFTVCSNNYTPLARSLLLSVREHHPEATLYVCLADRPCDGATTSILGAMDDLAVTVPAEELGIPNFAEFAFRYEIMELNTAVKPFMFLHLLQTHGFLRVIYFDPDILLFRRLDGVLTLLDAGASLVVTPHCCEPSERGAGPSDRTFMVAGTFNLGFLAARRCEETAGFIRWWSRQVRWDCVSEPAAGLFVDQKFVDLAPSFAPSLRVSHDPTLNVAYWNLAQRGLEQTPERWLAGGEPLTFFHFSGFDPGNPGRLSRHSDEFMAPYPSALAALLELYAARALGAAARGRGMPPYAYGRFASGVPIPGVVRRIFRDRHRAWALDPFETYETYLGLPAAEVPVTNGRFFVSNLLHALHGGSEWMQVTYDLGTPEGVRGLTNWFLVHGAREYELDPRLVAPVTARLDAPLPVAAPAVARRAGDADVTVVSYLSAPSGVGEAGRMTLRALQGVPGLRVEGIDLPLPGDARIVDGSCAGWLVPRGTAPIQVWHVNADQLPRARAEMADRLRPDAFRIAVPFWELEYLPSAWRDNFAGIDEVWAPSRFVQLALRRSIDRPVHHVPLALAPRAVQLGGRARFGLPARSFLFFFAFDFLSFVARKNPAGAIAAFRRAFDGCGDGFGLVIKTANAMVAPAAFADLQRLASEDRRIIVMDAMLDREEVTRLQCACDCLLSLHRSEGFGLLVAEAMMLGIPVIATDYGATTDLLSNETGQPVAFRMVPIAAGEYPFGDGQSWAEPDIAHAAWLMRAVAERPGGAAARAAAARAHVARRHGIGRVAAGQAARLRTIVEAMG